MGDSIGHLWPLLRAFLLTGGDHSMSYHFNASALSQMSMLGLAEFVDLDLDIDLQEEDEHHIGNIVREQCYGFEAYGNRQYEDPMVECTYNEECVQDGKVCDVMGQCVEMEIDIENLLLSANVEIGLNSPSCVHNQDSFSGASPWRRMQDILEQHGMCSHSNRVAYERMNDMFEKLASSETGCTTHVNPGTNMDYWTCDRSMVNWTWVRERPDFIPFPDDVDPTARQFDMREGHVSHSILHDGLFDIAPHLCDSEYMHSHSIGWCGLQHHTPSTPPPTPPQTARWMRTAPLHSQFSMMKPLEADIRRRTGPFVETRDKLRFMGLDADMLQYKTDATGAVLQNLAVQQCAALGVCQTEIFTAAGTHHNRMKPNQVSPMPDASKEHQDSVTVKVSDMTQCGPMGYKLETNAQTRRAIGLECVLDRAVTPIVYLLRDATVSASLSPPATASSPPLLSNANACLDLFGLNWHSGSTLRLNSMGNDILYTGGSRAENVRLQVWLNSFIVIDRVVVSGDRALMGIDIHTCVLGIAEFLQDLPPLYTLPQRVQGLYIMLEFGTYELPLFWWLKYTLARVVFGSSDALQVTATRLGSPRPLRIDAFQNRIAPNEVVPEGIITDDTTLRQFWSRLNVQELKLWSDAHTFVVAELARHIDSVMTVSAVMGCVSDFSADQHKIERLRVNAQHSDHQHNNNRKIEKMLDDIFTKYSKVPLWGGLRHDQNQELDAKTLTSAMQFSEAHLLADKDGLDSILSFAEADFDQLDDEHGFMNTFLKRTFDNLIDVDRYSPLEHPEDQVEHTVQFINNHTVKGIKILDLNFAMIFQTLSSANRIQDYTAEYLGNYDKIFEDDASSMPHDAQTAADTAARPTFSTGCLEQKSCVGHIRQHCIFDRNNRDALLAQGKSSGWNKLEAVLQLYAGDEAAAFRSIEMCKKTDDNTLFGFTNPLTGTASSPQFVYGGGRCSLADLVHEDIGPGSDFVPHKSSDLAEWKLMFGGGMSLDDAGCGMAEDDGPPVLLDEPFVDTTGGNHAHFVGDQYVSSPSVRPTNKLCHRIDSGCVTPDFASRNQLFPIDPVQLRYDRLETNAHTQANGRMWEKSISSRPEKFKTSEATVMYGDMYSQTLDIERVFTTSTDDIWAAKTNPKPKEQCRVSKITWPVGLAVQPYVLNSDALGDDVSFSHVIYSDRVLQRRRYEDGTEQQLYAHHFVGGGSDKMAGKQITSPTPLMSHCDDQVHKKSYGNLHRFKKVNFEDIGKTRMYERYHRFNQNIGVDSNFEPLTTSLSENAKTFLGSTSKALDILEEYYAFWQDSKVSAPGMLGSAMFFNSQFRWTASKTASKPPNPVDIPLIQNTCALKPVRSRFARQVTSLDCTSEQKCMHGGSNCVAADWQKTPTTNSWQDQFTHARLPLHDAKWDAYTLAAYYEQDAYEQSTIRPWWSSTVCDMVQNFADRSTNFYFLDLLFETLPTKMMSMIGFFDDKEKRVHNTKTWNTDRDFEQIADAFTGGQYNLYRKPDNGEYDSMSWRREMRYISDPKSTHDYYDNDNTNDNYKRFAENNNLAATNAFTQLMNMNLLLSTRFARVLGADASPTTLSFAACKYSGGRGQTALSNLAPGICESMQKNKRRITKPSLWSEVDGSPGEYLIACNPTETEGCHPILVQPRQGTTAGVRDAATNIWSDNMWGKSLHRSGACSYSVQFEPNYFCDPLIIDKGGLVQHCNDDPNIIDQHPKPARGEENILWTCATCNKFSSTRPILTNPRSTSNTLLHKHRVGCGIYRRETNDTTRTVSGPMTATHQTYSALMDDVVSALGGIFDDEAHIESMLKQRLLHVFGDKLFIHDNAVWWNAASVENTQVHPKIVAQFTEFGLGKSMGYAVQGCPLGTTPTTAQGGAMDVDCAFPVYDAGEAFDNSILFRNDLDNGCMAEDNGQDHLSKTSCGANITRSTVDRIKSFTEQVHRDTFGLELPMVAVGETISTRVANSSKVSWIDGVLPFYATSARSNAHLPDADYLGYVLDNEARCTDSYKGKSLSQYACYLDGAGVVQLVVPWLGKNYSFLKAGNRLKILEYAFDTGMDIPDQELFRVEMGTDICFAADRKTPLPCTATACIDEEYKTFQNATAFCASSRFADRYYKAEVPKKSNRIYIERLHQEQNLYNPDAPYSQCYVKYTPHDQERVNGKQCRHMQAPIGYSPSVVRPAVKGVSSLNRSRVEIAAARIVRHEFTASPTPAGHPSLWAGEQLSLENTMDAVSFATGAPRARMPTTPTP